MRWILPAFVALFCVHPSAYGQNSPSEGEAIHQLKKLEVLRDWDVSHAFANLRLSYADTLKALELLRHVKKLENISVKLGKSEVTEEFWKRIAAIPTLKQLHFNAEHLTNDDLKRIADLKQLTVLTLYYPGTVSDAHIRELHSLKNLGKLSLFQLSYRKASPTALAELKLALPGVKDIVFKKHFFMELVEIMPKDDLLVKLRKEKLLTPAQ
jgi:hypothetical protein